MVWLCRLDLLMELVVHYHLTMLETNFSLLCGMFDDGVYMKKNNRQKNLISFLSIEMPVLADIYFHESLNRCS